MTYDYLPEHLVATAELVRQGYLENALGLSAVKTEESIHKQIDFRPTLSVKRKDHHVVCVEISEVIMPITISSFILQCQQQHYPVLLYVAIPSGNSSSDFQRHLRDAKASGVGILEADHGAHVVSVLNDPLSLSLTGLRSYEMGRFPKKYRAPITDAVSTFRNGAPNKGCSMVFDEIEDLTRKVAIRTHKKGYWNKPLKNPKEMEGKMPWASALESLRDRLNRSTAKADGNDLALLSVAMLDRIIGITPHRNESAHKPRSLKALRERDGKLRTRMEAAIDILMELIDASKCLRV